MPIGYQVLGQPRKDNAVYVTVDTGNAVHRLLFDCGEGCPAQLKTSALQDIDHLFFSHFHLDHAAGFDTFLRANYRRETKPVFVWGPSQTIEIVQHRLLGFIWNLVEGLPGEWCVTEIDESELRSARFLTAESFAVSHPDATRPFDGVLVGNSAYRVEARIMDHGTPSLAYTLRESDKVNVSEAALDRLGVPPGPWLQAVKDSSEPDDRQIDLEGRSIAVGELRQRLLVTSPGGSFAYLTDFLLDDTAMERLLGLVAGCDTIVCECQYSAAESDLARANHHITSVEAAQLAAKAKAKRLVLFHVSQRYETDEVENLLKEARGVFPESYLPEEWETV